MQGYKASNGNYITGKELEQRQRKYKQELKEHRQKQEEELQKRDILIMAEYRQRKKEDEQYKKDKETFIQEAKTFLEYISKNFNYRMYLIAWDICNHDYYRIESDLYRNKINKDMIKSIYEIACRMFSKLEFNTDLIAE
jgi:signal recognition particle GTPase